MKKLILGLYFLLFTFCLQAQEEIFDSSSFEKVIYQGDTITVVYSLINTKKYDNTDEKTEKTAIGDSLAFNAYLFASELQKQKVRANNFKKAFERRPVGEDGRLLKDVSGDSYYKHAAENLAMFFVDKTCTVTIDGTSYDAIFDKPNQNVRLNVTGHDNYIIHLLSQNSFLVKDFFIGEDIELFETAKSGKRCIFWDGKRTVKIVLIE